MSERDFARHLTNYLGRYLPGQRNLSSNTIASYRDAFKLLISFFIERGHEPETLSMDDVNRENIESYLDWLEDRGCAGTTINQRLCAVKAFIGYVKTEDPTRLLHYQRTLSIKQRKTAMRAMIMPGREGVAAMLRNPDTTTSKGRRDVALLTLLYDSAARVSELCSLRVRDLRLDDPAVVTLTGKGRKIRTVPLMRATADMMRGYLDEFHPNIVPETLDDALFFNARRQPLTRAAIAAIVARHAKGAREAGAPIPDGITPHSLRHQKAIDLLESGVNLVYIRDLLGHKSVTTTEIYARVSLKRKREVLEKAACVQNDREYPDWSEDATLMAWLNDLCRVR